MSREVRRVPLDFGFPIGETWTGYLTPDNLRPDDCPACVRGYTPAGEWLHTLCHRLTMLAGDIRDQADKRPLHPWLRGDTYPPHARYRLDQQGRHVPAVVLRPSSDILDLVAGLTGTSPEALMAPFGTCSSAAYHAQSKIIEAAGLDPDTWGTCPTCNGHGSIDAYPGQAADREAWEPTEPPTGEGWQLWQTVSEGGPASPVLPTAEALAQWLTTPAAGFAQTSIEGARRFIEAGWAPSMVSIGGVLVSGVDSYRLKEQQ